MSDVLYTLDFRSGAYVVDQHIDELNLKADRVGFEATPALTAYLVQTYGAGTKPALQRDSPTPHDPFTVPPFEDPYLVPPQGGTTKYFDATKKGRRNPGSTPDFHLNCGYVDSKGMFNKVPGVVSLPFPT